MPEQTIVREGALGHDREKGYVHVPFDVPPGASRIEVEYAYSERIGSDPRLTGGNTVDLGVFDERGIDPLTAGFRGWSGSERASFFIAEDEATPGYLAGPLGAGRWHVLLGLYKIAPQGCTWRVQVRIRSEAGRRAGRGPRTGAGAAGDLPSSPPPAPFAPWLRGELHCHSWHSDGDRSAADVVSLARARGLDFLAVSDHNTTASQARARPAARPRPRPDPRRRGDDLQGPFQHLGHPGLGGLSRVHGRGDGGRGAVRQGARRAHLLQPSQALRSALGAPVRHELRLRRGVERPLDGAQPGLARLLAAGCWRVAAACPRSEAATGTGRRSWTRPSHAPRALRRSGFTSRGRRAPPRSWTRSAGATSCSPTSPTDRSSTCAPAARWRGMPSRARPQRASRCVASGARVGVCCCSTVAALSSTVRYAETTRP